MKETKKKSGKKWFLGIVVLGIVLGCMALFGKSGGGTALDLSGLEYDPEQVIVGSENVSSPSEGTAGYFFEDGKLLRFYDFETEKTYILCGKANCMHTGEGCAAYVPGYTVDLLGGTAKGVAQVGEYVYFAYLRTEQDETYGYKIPIAYDLVRMDPQTGARKTIVSFPALYHTRGTVTDEGFYTENIDSVSYCNGWAWLNLTMTQPDPMENGVQTGEPAEYGQLTGVNLETGDIVKLTDYTDESEGYVRESFELITPDTIYYSLTRASVKQILWQAELAKYTQEDGTVHIHGQVFDNVSAYWEWCSDQPRTHEYYAYHVDSGETELLHTEQSVELFALGRNPELDSYRKPYMNQASRIWVASGVYQGRVLVGEYLANAQGEYWKDDLAYYLYDLDTGEKTPIYETHNEYPYDTDGAILTDGGILPDGRIFYGLLTGADTIDIYEFDCNTDQARFLFADRYSNKIGEFMVTMFITQSWDGGFLGRHTVHQNNTQTNTMTWISEEDFYAGNFDNIKVHRWAAMNPIFE